MKLLANLMGAHFHPPAKALLEQLPAGTELVLQPEPENPYDPNAVKVLILGQDLRLGLPLAGQQFLELALPGYGLDFAEVMARDEVWLGYVAKERAAEAKVLMLAPHKVTLRFSPEGKPQVEIETEDGH